MSGSELHRKNRRCGEPVERCDPANVQCVDLGKLEPTPAMDNQLVFLQEMVRAHGDCFRFQTPISQITVFNHPQHVKEVLRRKELERSTLARFILGRGLLTTAGAFWRHRRSLMQRFFLKENSQSYATVISSTIESTIQQWQARAADGQVVDVIQEMNRITLRVIIKAFCSTTLSDGEIDAFSEALTLVLNDIGELQRAATGSRPVTCPERNRRLKTAMSVIDGCVNDMIAKRKRNVSGRDDLLSHLLNTTNEFGRPMSDQEIHNEIKTLLLAGHETTAMTLSWVWYVLSRYPDAEARLHRELDRLLPSEFPDALEIQKFVWVQQIFQEIMRLYPPVWLLVRHAKQDVQIGRYKVMAGDSALVSPFMVHRHQSYWDEPNSFVPERFTGGLAAWQKDAYMPFGQGSHLCIGMHLAQLEQTMVLAVLAKRFCVRPLTGQKGEMVAGVTLRMKSGFLAKIELREHKQQQKLVSHTVEADSFVRNSTRCIKF